MTDSERDMTVRLRMRTEKPLHEGSYWSDSDKETLRRMFSDGSGITEIALTLKRSESAVIQMMEKLDLFGRHQHPRRRRKQHHGGCTCSHCGKPVECARANQSNSFPSII